MSVSTFRADWLTHAPTLAKYAVGSFCPADFSSTGSRSKHLVSGASASVWLDIDKLAEEAWGKVLEHLAAFEAEAWTTWSYAGGVVSARVRVTVDREHVSGAEVRGARAGLSTMLGGVGDRACFSPNAVFYRPAVHPDRVSLAKKWFFDGEKRPSVDDLVALGGVGAREAARRRLGLVVPTGRATAADRKCAREWLRSELGRLRFRDDGRKRALYPFGGRVRATAEIGGLDLEGSMALVREVLAKNDPEGLEERWRHFVRGVETANRVDPVRSDEGLIQEEVARPLVWRRLEENLSGEAETGTLEDAKAALKPAIHDAVRRSSARRVVIHAPAGLGKTRAAAEVLGEHEEQAAFLAPNHAIAHEFTTKLPTATDYIHLHSPMVDVPGVPGCELVGDEREEALKRVFLWGHKQYEVCAECPLRKTCQGKAAWQERNAAAKKARLVVASYQNREAALGRLTVVDEQPPEVEIAEVSPRELRLARKLPVELWTDPELEPEGSPPVYSPTRMAAPALVEVELAAAAVCRYWRVRRTPGARHYRQPDGVFVAALPLSFGDIILSATPAEQDAEVVRLSVGKHARHERVIFPRARSTRRTLTLAFVEEAARFLSVKAGVGRGLLITFKTLAERASVPMNVDVGWYGNIRGLNKWDKHVAVLCVGTPWDKRLQEAEALRCEDVWARARMGAAAELRQAVDRLRAVSRPEEALWMGVIGQVAPVGWTNADTTLAAWRDESPEALQVLRAQGWTAKALAAELGLAKSTVSQWFTGERTVPEAYLARLEALIVR